MPGAIVERQLLGRFLPPARAPGDGLRFEMYKECPVDLKSIFARSASVTQPKESL
ncbi:hypothetical protein SM0020_27131 [Sinorhizobium meliloti CCNWSX0020]|uniref:Uncharacterized protein n=1 Tax=Sinorhizobium meliloti CCNWSX0020 TaxID=1107881 RepID=H0G7E4_RHIML|nr:hypothetical protein SM0020_27131 [Sinorhizobium meliloti CCNWSX0020]